MFDWISRSNPFLGVDVGSASVKVVQLAPSGRGVRLKHATLIEHQSPNGVDSELPVQILARLFNREKNLAQEKLATLFSVEIS